jgi:hypothetical protein
MVGPLRFDGLITKLYAKRAGAVEHVLEQGVSLKAVKGVVSFICLL